MIRDAISRGVARIIIGIGGSATNDGGIGMLAALGATAEGAEGNDVTALLAEGAAALRSVLSVDLAPARDTVARLHGYLAHFDPSFIGVTGSAAQVDAVLKAYGIGAKRMAGGSDAGYMMSHSSYLYFVDTRGMLRALMPFGRPATDIAHDVQLLLRN